MPADHFERGAIVRCNNKLWIVWTYPRGRFANPTALPVMPQTGPQAVVVGVVNDDPVGVRSLTPRALAIERCAGQIGRSLGQLTLEQRIGLERALDALVDEIAWHKRDPWC